MGVISTVYCFKHNKEQWKYVVGIAVTLIQLIFYAYTVLADPGIVNELKIDEEYAHSNQIRYYFLFKYLDIKFIIAN